MNLPSHYQIQLTLTALVVGPILVILGACVSLEALYCQAKWESVPAKVTRAKVTRSQTSRGDSHCYFEYAYEVAGQRFTGSSIDHGMLDPIMGISARVAIGKFPRGSDITVYYDPRMPQRSVLWNGIPREGFVEILLGSVLFVGAFFSLQHRKGVKVVTSPIDSTYKFEQTAESKANEEQERQDAINQWRENLKQRAL